MSQLSKILTLIPLICILTACEPTTIMTTTIPKPVPKTIKPIVLDEQCMTRCATAKRFCEKLCRLKHANCFNREIEKNHDILDPNNHCYTACNCEVASQTCYRSCS